MDEHDSKRLFCDYLRSMEGEKRSEAFFSEYYFSEEVRRHFPVDLIAFDWLYTKMNGNEYIFFKLLGKNSSHSISLADRHFIRLLIGKGHHVFLIHNDDKNDFVAAKVKEITDDLSVRADPKCCGDAKEILMTLSSKNDFKEYNGASHPYRGSSIESLFDAIYAYSGDVDNFLLVRKFIYEVFYPVFHRQPIDLDALLLNVELNQLVCVEFKRKGPAKRMYKFSTGDFSTSRLEALKWKCKKELSSLKPAEDSLARDRLKRLIEEQNVVHKDTPCFGLDLFPHSEFVRFCHENQLSYFQINWHRPKKNARDLLDLRRWSLLEKEEFYCAQIGPESFSGFNFTHGKDSGMNGDLRFQEMVECSRYRLIKAQTDMRSTLDLAFSSYQSQKN